MALLNVGNDTAGANPPVVPMSQYAAGQRYTGLSALYMNPAWQSPNASDNLLAQARERQAAALRKAQEDAARLAAAAEAPKPFQVDPFSGAKPLAPPVLQENGLQQNTVPWANNGLGPSQDPAANMPPMSMRADTLGPVKGAERAGFDQEKVWEANKLVGWRYVANGQQTDADVAAAGQDFTDTANRLDYVQDGLDRRPAVSDVATRRMTVDAMTNADQFGLEGSANPYTWGPYVTEVQTQTYGQPTWVQDADGNMIPTFPISDSEKNYMGVSGGQKFIGIDPEYQAMGWVHINMPGNQPGPNASLAEKQAYREAVRQSIVAPRYKVGDQNMWAANMGPDERLEFQKALRAAGLYEPGDVIHKGILSTKETNLLHDLMGEANQTGLEWQEVLADYTEKHRRVVAAQKAAGGGGGGGGGITQQTTIQYSPTSIASGRAMLAGVLEQALGRAPSDQELSDYMAMLNAAENKSPVKTVTNYVKSGSSQTSTSRTTPSEVDPAEMAREFASKIGGGDEMFAYQATSYLDRLMQSLIGAQNG